MKRVMITILLGLVAGTCLAHDPDAALSVDEIVARANHMALYQGTDSKGKVSMTITDRTGQTRRREFNILRKDGSGDDGDQKYYTLFQRPADVRKMTFMVHKHAALSWDDDRWLYLPGLDLVKRIAASDKRTSFAGSDFLYEDISGRSPAEDDHQLVETTAAHYLIKNTPKRPGSVEFAYYLAHIDRQSFLPVKMEFFKDRERRYRVIEAIKIEPVETEEDGQTVTYPTVTVSVARDLETQSQTKMVFSNIRYNTGLKDSLFAERYLRRPPRDAMR